MRYLLDTNICIYIIRHHPPQVIDRLKACGIGDVAISSITLAELEYGVAKSSRPEQNREALLNFAAPLEIIPFDDQASVHYGEIRAGLERSGQPIGAMDLLIAAHARSIPLTLATNNTREFARIPRLLVENWV
jgi:tRNA(fMet)-specific endonuclease VapC